MRLYKILYLLLDERFFDQKPGVTPLKTAIFLYFQPFAP